MSTKVFDGIEQIADFSRANLVHRLMSIAPNYQPAKTNGILDDLADDLVRAHGGHCGDRNHWHNPHLASQANPKRFAADPDGYSPLHWHTDTEDGHSPGNDMYLMIAGQAGSGTWFSGPIDLKPYELRFQIEPFKLYRVSGALIHSSPIGATGNRTIYRWYQSAKTQESPQTWRDEDGKLFTLNPDNTWNYLSGAFKGGKALEIQEGHDHTTAYGKTYRCYAAHARDCSFCARVERYQ